MGDSVIQDAKLEALSRRVSELEVQLKAGEKISRRNAFLAITGITFGASAACAANVNSIFNVHSLIKTFTEDEPDPSVIACNKSSEVCQELRLYSDAIKLLDGYDEMGYTPDDIEVITYNQNSMEIDGVLLFGNHDDHTVYNRLLVDEKGNGFVLIGEDVTNYMEQVVDRGDLEFLYYSPVNIELGN